MKDLALKEQKKRLKKCYPIQHVLLLTPKKTKTMPIPPSQYDTLTVPEATRIQKELRQQIDLQPLSGIPLTIAGADISLNRFSEIIYAGIVVLRYSDLRPLAYSLVRSITRFPYVPGFWLSGKCLLWCRHWNRCR